MSNSGASLCEQYTDGTEVESGNLVFKKDSISFSFVNVYGLSVFKTMKTLLILVFTLPTNVNPLATGLVELLPFVLFAGLEAASLWHLLLHPSPLTKFPSSHC